MRIAHVTWLPYSGRWPGLVAKLQQQATAARRAGLPITVIALSDDPKPESASAVRWEAIPGAGPRGWLSRRLRRCACIEASLDLAEWDRVVLRYPGAADLSAQPMLERWGARIISEHHTDEAAELAALSRGPLGWSKRVLERTAGPRFLGRVAGLTAVTEEIRRRELSRYPVRYSAVVGNGVDVEGTAATGCAAFSGEELRLAFVAGGFPSWQGLDRLLRGLLLHRGLPRIVLHLIGDVSDSFHLSLLTRLQREAEGVTVVPHGTLAMDAMDALLARAHLGISTLALHRKGMTSACPLKSREYAARGLPFVYAYDDADAPADEPGWFRIPDGEGPIEIHALAEAAASVDARGSSVVSAAMRRHARSRLDWSSKLSELHAFARTTM